MGWSICLALAAEHPQGAVRADQKTSQANRGMTERSGGRWGEVDLVGSDSVGS